jgi:AcrR family transcriptional regulator
MNEGEPHKNFTVQEVVERSGPSLRLFYQYFSGKHELLLALFEETVRSSTECLRDKIADEDDALGRLHRFVITDELVGDIPIRIYRGEGEPTV